MGQFYPFVITPMEYEVCLEVSSYLESMRDADVQSKVNKKERITCDILYNSTEKRQVHRQELTETLFSAEWLNRWCDSDNGLRMEDIISMYLKCIDARFGQDSEKEMHKQVIDWKVFETASEPELKNYAHTRWYRAYIGAKRQLQLLYAYIEKHPDSVKTKKCIDMWKKRIE